MKPVDQTQFGIKDDDPPDVVGNCFQACIASLWELPIAEVPHFCETRNWWNKLQRWLEPYSLSYLEIPVHDGEFDWACFLHWHIIAGNSPRGPVSHAVVGYAGQMKHDPHPSRAGLTKVTEIGIFVVRDPSSISYDAARKERT